MTINGWLNINKPAKITSNYVNSIIKKKINLNRKFDKCGFLGTLDPFATGVLTFALGNATKCIDFITNNTKTYNFTVKWGFHTDTYDLDGKLLETTNHIPSVEEIENNLKFFIGEITQFPPIFSATKINGKRACDLARKGNSVTTKPKIVKISNLQILNHNNTVTKFTVTCQKGCYVRSLAIDMAQKLSSLCHVTELCRINDGVFNIQNAITIDNLMKMEYDEVIESVLPIDCPLDDIPAIRLNSVQKSSFQLGGIFPCLEKNSLGTVRVYDDSLQLNGFATIKNGMVYPKKVFNQEIKDVDYKRAEDRNS